ncbi:unnamed protein product [Clonostachys rosea]|uniref:C2H2-type domain-containing protein n=1 Tax=Bionectria ochroleuca TaxID=29856 RepID=A0ABY6UAS0_BIOOC|nr:unnamed protein product [Clonostachys rosea]
MANNTSLIPIGAQRALTTFANTTVNGQNVTAICNEGTIVMRTDDDGGNNIAIYNDGTVTMPTRPSDGKKTTRYVESDKINTTKRNRDSHDKSHRSHHRTHHKSNEYEYRDDDAVYGYTDDAFNDPDPRSSNWNKHGNYNETNGYHYGTSNGDQLISTNHTRSMYNAPGDEALLSTGTNGNNIAIYNAPTGKIVIPASIADTNNLAIHNAPNGTIIMPTIQADGSNNATYNTSGSAAVRHQKKSAKCGRCGERFATREDKQAHRQTYPQSCEFHKKCFKSWTAHNNKYSHSYQGDGW